MKNNSRQTKGNTTNTNKKSSENKKFEENISFKAYNTRNFDSKEKVKNKSTLKNIDSLLNDNKKSKNKLKKRENGGGSEDSEKIKENKTPESKSSHKKEKKRCVPLKKKIKKINNLNNNEDTSSNNDMEKENIYADDDGKLSVLDIDRANKSKNLKKKDPPKSVEFHNSSSLENTKSSPNSNKQKKHTKLDVENRINNILSQIKNTASERKEDENVSREGFKLNPEEFMEDLFLCISPSKRDSISKKENNPISNFTITPHIPLGNTRYINIKELVTEEVVSKVDYILCMIELVKNNEYYNLNNITKTSKYFWENILKIEDLRRILGNNLNFIRKCWTGLKQVIDSEEIIADVMSMKYTIDFTCPK
jgi:hypothetical protein